MTSREKSGREGSRADKNNTGQGGKAEETSRWFTLKTFIQLLTLSKCRERQRKRSQEKARQRRYVLASKRAGRHNSKWVLLRNALLFIMFSRRREAAGAIFGNRRSPPVFLGQLYPRAGLGIPTPVTETHPPMTETHPPLTETHPLETSL